MIITELQRYQGALLGLAVGDALGTTIEFKPRGSFPKHTEMVGGGVFNLNPGEWTDDTSMALCLAESLLECNGFDATDQMTRYWKWIEEGYMSSNGRMFDIGETTSEALCKFRKDGNPFAGSSDEKCSGNGSLMRLVPIPMFFKDDVNRLSFMDYANLSSELTHASLSCRCSCIYFSGLVVGALNGITKEQLLSPYYFPVEDKKPVLEPDVLMGIVMGVYKNKTRDQIKSTGYVIHTLEAALWCFHNSTNFEDGCIEAVNLGEDADTVGAVYGQIAGAYYGVQSIPQRWVEKTKQVCLILDVANRLYEKRKN